MGGDRVGRGEQTAKLTEREDEIMNRFAAGETAVSICRDLDVPKSTFYQWLNDPEHPERKERFGDSRELGADAMADESIAILDDARGQKDLTSAQASIIREQSQSRRWLAARLKALYRDKVEVTAALGIGDLFLESLIASNAPRNQRIEDQVQEGNRRRIAVGLALPDDESNKSLPEAEFEVLPDDESNESLPDSSEGAVDEFITDRDMTVAEKLRVALEKEEDNG